jgi:hypothetical protein
VDLAPLPAGLCDRCLYARRVTSGRGSQFTLCERSRTDPRFPRYPRLPVVACGGFEPQPAADGVEADDAGREPDDTPGSTR